MNHSSPLPGCFFLRFSTIITTTPMGLLSILRALNNILTAIRTTIMITRVARITPPIV
ncbi:MAG: hypothetical protein SFY68_06335 [Candidatus Sumerlaeia bacterium]|nr:hypothetical protein [Candidatus Sumerlaeia bacterium]